MAFRTVTSLNRRIVATVPGYKVKAPVPALPWVPRPRNLRPNRPRDSTPSPNPGTSRRFPDFPGQVYLWRAAPGNAGTAWGHRRKPGYAPDLGKCNRFSQLSG